MIETLIPKLKRFGLRVGCIKHHPYGFEMDKPGKDSWRHKHAGAATTLIASPRQIGMVMDVGYDYDPEELKKFFDAVDIILAEGYKQSNHPKLEVFRKSLHDKPICKGDNRLLAVVTDTPVEELAVPCFSPKDPDGLARFLIDVFDLTCNQPKIRGVV